MLTCVLFPFQQVRHRRLQNQQQRRRRRRAAEHILFVLRHQGVLLVVHLAAGSQKQSAYDDRRSFACLLARCRVFENKFTFLFFGKQNKNENRHLMLT